MSAECPVHGVDLHGDTHSGLVCPICEREAEADVLRAVLGEFVAWFDGRFPAGGKEFPGLTLFTIAERAREALNP